MQKGAGIAIILGKKLLLCHPTNSSWDNTHSIPKGLIDEGESELQAAIRECKEEVGIDLSAMINILEGPDVIEYRNKKATPHKIVTYYVLRINSVAEIGLETEVVPKEQLQFAEVDWAGFVAEPELSKKILWRLKSILDKI
ncbi:MAG: NUDIX hydrolase [bacterium]|nr:NUDIX hydrolase [bacterium]